MLPVPVLQIVELISEHIKCPVLTRPDVTGGTPMLLFFSLTLYYIPCSQYIVYSDLQRSGKDELVGVRGLMFSSFTADGKHRPCATLLEPLVGSHPLYYIPCSQYIVYSGSQQSGKDELVGVRGFEPPTSASRTQRSNQAEPHSDIMITDNFHFSVN
jgi:hypothetical protein